jgi:hypothetical protein
MYTHITKQEARRAYMDFHPLAASAEPEAPGDEATPKK